MGQLQISLFDPLQISLDDKPISDFRTRKVMALLVYLAAEPETAHRRETIMTLLWPGMPDTSARANLRQVLFHLRKAIPDFEQADPAGTDEAAPFFFANRHTIQINPDAPIVIDASQFSALLEQVQAHDHHSLLTCNQCQEKLEAATDLYTGHFLADFYLEDSNEFEEWAEIERQKYLRRALDALGILTAMAIRQQAYAAARQRAERQLELDDFRESAYQQLMEILARNGQRNEAMSVYERCRRLFNDALGMDPSARTTDLYEQILTGDLRLDSLREQGVRGYELQEEIGSGAYGVIHRSVQPVIGREVAVKIIRRRYANDPDFIRRFEAEAQTIARLEHPHIVPIYDFWRDPDGAYLVMRLLRGGNLLTALAQGPWSLERTQRLLDQIAPALAAAHSQDIIHRDIKPANILFDENGNAYLSDFGIAKDLQNDDLGIIDGESLSTPDYISPEQIQEAPVSPRSDIYSLGAVLYEVLTGEKPFPDAPLITVIQNHLSTPLPLVCDSRPDLSPQIDAVIQQATAKEPADRFPDVLAFAEAFRQSVAGRLNLATIAAQAPVPADVANPYKGLRAFQESDALDFYGRDNLIGQLLAHLSESRFLAVVGPSGSGKSSVVKAGVIPALRQGAIPGSEQWFVAEMTPGTHPLEELELALWPVAVDPPPSLVEPMERDARGLLRTIRRILPNEEDAQLLLVIDQFEELWSQTDPERRTYFLDSLMAAISAPRSPLHVIITLRADFYDRPLQVQSLAELVKRHTELVLPLTQDELTWAIQEPARRMGVEFEDTVLSAIVAEVHDQPGALPLLQYALMELFEARSGNKIERQAFDDIGGVLGALPRRADEIYASLSPSEQAATRQFFLRLVTLGEGVEDTRRRVLLSELEALDLDETSFEDIIDQFGTARLLTFDHDPLTRQPTVEVAHEALLREWNQLRTWLEESRDDVRLQRLLAAAVGEWQSSGQNPGYLLRGARLSQYEGWATSTTVALTADEQAYLADSIAAREARQAEEATRQARELETAKQLAETEHQRAEEQVAAAKNLRRRAYYLGAALVAAALLALIAIFAGVQANDNAQTAEANAAAAATQEALAATKADEALESANIAATAEAMAVIERDIAEEQTRLSTSRELALAAINNLDSDPELSILLGLEALKTSRTGTAEEALHHAVQTSRIRARMLSDEDHTVVGAAFSPDGSQFVTTNTAGTAIVWDRASGEELVRFDRHRQDAIPFGEAQWVLSPVYSPDGKEIATGGKDGTVRIWDPETGEERLVIKTNEEELVVEAIDFSPDGTRLLTAGWDSVARVWDVESGELLLAIEETHPGERNGDFQNRFGVRGVTFSPDGRRIGTAGIDNMAVIWDAESGEELLRLAGHENLVYDIEFSPDGSLIATSSFDGSAIIWDAETGEQIHLLLGHASELRKLGFSPDGERLGTASADGTAKIWEVETGRELFTLAGHNDMVQDIVFSPDGLQLVTTSSDGTARLWDAGPGAVEEKTVLINAHEARYSPDGDTFITTEDDGTARIWDVATGKELRQFEGTDWSGGAEISPDGAVIAAAFDDGTAIIWDLQTGELRFTLAGHEDWVNNLAISPDSSLLATAGQDGKVIVWEIDSGQEVMTLDHGETVWGIAFSPDGSLLASAGSGNAETDQTGSGTVFIWDIASGERVRELIGHNERLKRAHFSSDGAQLFTAGWDGTARLWDVASGEELFVLGVGDHSGPIWGADISPDGSLLATGSIDGSVKLWDAKTGTLLITLVEDTDGINNVDFSPDGTRLIAAVSDGTLREYVLPLDELIALGESRLTRSLADAECRQYLHMDACPAE